MLSLYTSTHVINYLLQGMYTTYPLITCSAKFQNNRCLPRSCRHCPAYRRWRDHPTTQRESPPPCRSRTCPSRPRRRPPPLGAPPAAPSRTLPGRSASTSSSRRHSRGRPGGAGRQSCTAGSSPPCSGSAARKVGCPALALCCLFLDLDPRAEFVPVCSIGGACCSCDAEADQGADEGGRAHERRGQEPPAGNVT